MKNADKTSLALLLIALLTACGEKRRSVEPELASYVRAKEAQAGQLASDGNLEMPPEAGKLFAAIQSDNFTSAAKYFSQLEVRSAAGPNALERAKTTVIEKFGYPTRLNAVESPAWHAIRDAYWAYALSRQWSNEFLQLAINDIVTTIPTNAILFAGSDVSRFSISAWAETRTNGRPCYVISQTQLADWSFLAYLTKTYGAKIRLPDENLFTSVLQSEQGSSTGAGPSTIVKRVNSALARQIFDQNPRDDVFVQPYWIFDWMYPRVVPEGPLLKIRRKQLPRLPPDSLKANREYWAGICKKLIGDWITETTEPKDVCDFVEKVYLRRDLSGFKGDVHYVSDARAQEQFAGFRFATADLYLWRCVQATRLDEKQWMQNECLLAFMQSFALGPRNAKVAYYFADILTQINHYDEALRIVEIAILLQPADPDLKAKREEIRAKLKSAASN